MKLTSVPRKAPGHFIDEVDGELILSRKDSQEGLIVNETAALVWELCDGKARVEEIIQLLEESYPIAASEIADDVLGALAALSEAKALEVS